MSTHIGDSDQVNQVTLLAVGDNLIHIEVVQSGQQEDGTIAIVIYMMRLKT